MTEFKKRLKVVGNNILYWGITISIILILTWLANLIPQVVLAWVAGIILGLCILGALIGFVLYVWDFIKWLFIEPFRKK